MEVHRIDTAKLFPCFTSRRNCRLPLLVENSTKKIPNSNNTTPSQKQGIQFHKPSKKDLSRILRTQSAIKAIEKKANSSKFNNLWPRAVLEALDDAIRNCQWELALKIFDLLRKQHWYEPRCQTYAKLLVMLGKCRQSNQATMLFDIMKSDRLQPTIDVYTALVSAYGLSGLLDEAFQMVSYMKTIPGCKPDVFTYSILIKCCIKLGHFHMVQQILDEMLSLGIECNAVIYNTVIDGYGKAELFELMESSLSEMLESGTCHPDVFTFNSIIGAYGRAGKIEKMEKRFEEFQLMGLKPDVMTYNILIKSYGKAGMYKKMGSVVDFMTKRFYSPTVVTYNIIIETSGKAGEIEKMDEIFLKMKHQGLKPNSITYCSLVDAYGKAGLVSKVDSILRQVENSDVVLDTPFFNCVVSAYGRAGDVEKMTDIFMGMKEYKCKPDDITIATMIEAYLAQGMTQAAQDLESQMAKANNNSGSLAIAV